MVDCIAMSPLGGIYRSIRLGGQDTSPRDKEGYHGNTSILNYHIWSCLIYSNIMDHLGLWITWMRQLPLVVVFLMTSKTISKTGL